MLIKTKINFKKYILLSLIPTSISCLIIGSFTGASVIFLLFIAALINQLMLIEIVFNLLVTDSGSDVPKRSNWFLAMLFLFKMAIIIGAIALGAHFIGQKIIIGIINYVVQIFILIFSIKQS